MSVQDKIERSLKQIHVLFSEGPIISGNPDKVVVDKKEVFAILEQLNLAIYEMMDQYEATSQARELAQRRSEKKGEELLERISRQADDVYAASLIYTDNALDQVQELLQKVMETSQRTWNQLGRELEREKKRVKKDQRELKDQLVDFKDSNKYLAIIENYNREREKKEQKKEGKEPKKRIQNEAKHYALNEIPEIRVNPAYFERRRQKAAQNEAESSKIAGEELERKEYEAEKPAKEVDEIEEMELLDLDLEEISSLLEEEEKEREAGRALSPKGEIKEAGHTVSAEEADGPEDTLPVEETDEPEDTLPVEKADEPEDILSVEETDEPDHALFMEENGDDIFADVLEGEAIEESDPVSKGEQEGSRGTFELPEIKVDLDAEYFKWQAERAANGTEDVSADEAESMREEEPPVTRKRERRFLFGRKG